MPTDTSVDFRVMTEPQQGASHEDLVAVATATERLGFDAFFRSDHYLRVGTGSGQPGPSDAWVSLAALASHTTRLRLGTLVSPVTFRPPAPLALIVAQLDQISDGRVELGLGAGWYDAEHAAFGLSFPPLRERHERLAEAARVITGLWSTRAPDTFSFTGDHYTVADSPGLPRPVQSPHPPLIIGGAGGPRSARLAAEVGNEYNVGFRSVADTAAVLERVTAASERVGRALVHSAALTLCIGGDEDEVASRSQAAGRDLGELRRVGLAGTPDEVAAAVRRYVEVGVTRFYLQLPDLTDLGQLELFASEVLPVYAGTS